MTGEGAAADPAKAGPSPGRKPHVPARVTAYVGLCAAAALLAWSASVFFTLQQPGLLLVAGAALFALAFFTLERQAVVFVWNRERITTAITEVSVLLGLLWLPTPYLVLAVPFPRLAIALATRRPLIKSAFNVSHGVLTLALGATVFQGLLALGWNPIPAAILGTIAYSLSAETLLSGLFRLLEGVPLWRVYRQRFLRPNVLALAWGIPSAVVLYALASLHPLAVLAAAPLLFLLNRYTAYEARADREISLYRQLALQSQALIGCESKEVIGNTTLNICLEALDARKALLRLGNGSQWERVSEGGAPTQPPSFSTPVLGREGRLLGELSAWKKPGRRADHAHDEALLRIIASQTAHAFESAEALFEVARQRDVVARQEKLSALGGLVAGVAHEVNNPLTYLSGNVELALLDLDDLERRYEATAEKPPIDVAETRRLLQTALGGAERIGEIVKALRAVARIRGNSEREIVPINKIVQNVFELMKIGVPDGVTLKCEPAAKDPAVIGFSSDLHQVVLNLAKNALEATAPNGGTVTVRVEAKADKVEIVVTDEGVGMNDETRKRLFQPFFTTKGAHGTGLGLSIVNSIVKDHAGEIVVESAEGKGSVFRVVLPRAA